MKHLNISDDAMKIILENSAWQQFGVKVTEAKQQIDESAEEVDEGADEHVCPLCQSHLQEAISDEALMEHTANVLEAVNAATLNEEEEEEDSDELYEEDESDDDDENSDDEDEEDLTEEEKKPKAKMKPKGKPNKEDLIAKEGEKVGTAMYKKMGGK
jgi:DNA repair exonuclease SbcCD ATPase subunit